MALAVCAFQSSLLPQWEDQTPQAAAGRGGMFSITKGPPHKATSSSHPPAQRPQTNLSGSTRRQVGPRVKGRNTGDPPASSSPSVGGGQWDQQTQQHSHSQGLQPCHTHTEDVCPSVWGQDLSQAHTGSVATPALPQRALSPWRARPQTLPGHCSGDGP